MPITCIVKREGDRERERERVKAPLAIKCIGEEKGRERKREKVSSLPAFVSFCSCLNHVLGKESQTTGLPDGRTAEGVGARRRASGEGDDRGAE